MFDVMGMMVAVATSGEPDLVEPPVHDRELGETADVSEEELAWEDAEPVPAPVLESPPPLPEEPSPEEVERKKAHMRARGITIGGWTTFGITYAAALTIGVASIDLAKEDQHQRVWGRRMVIPVGGPFAAAFVSKSATGTLFTVLTGLAQTTGIAIGIAGAVMLSKQKRASRLAFAAAPDRGGMHMGATWRF